MRNFATLLLGLAVAGCGSNTWWNPPFAEGFEPNRPMDDGANIRRAMGSTPAMSALRPQPGDIWPGPLPPIPTLGEIERESGLGDVSRLTAPLPLSSGAPNAAPLPQIRPPATTGTPGAAIPAPPERDPAGRIVQSPSGPGVTSGGTQGYQTMTTPRGTAIVVPNGNGTSTVIHSDGRIETIPTPR
jgi:hypothetical protein